MAKKLSAGHSGNFGNADDYISLDCHVIARVPGRIMEDQRVAYWRKNWDVHTFFKDCAVQKGEIMPNDDFDNREYRIQAEDLDEFEKRYDSWDYQISNLFFASVHGTDEAFIQWWRERKDMYYDNAPYIGFLEEARMLMKEGWTLFYFSSVPLKPFPNVQPY